MKHSRRYRLRNAVLGLILVLGILALVVPYKIGMTMLFLAIGLYLFILWH